MHQREVKSESCYVKETSLPLLNARARLSLMILEACLEDHQTSAQRPSFQPLIVAFSRPPDQLFPPSQSNLTH